MATITQRGWLSPKQITRPFVTAYRQLFGPSDWLMLVVAIGMSLLPAFTLQAAEWSVDYGLIFFISVLGTLVGFVAARSTMGEVISLMVMATIGGGIILILAAQSVVGGMPEVIQRTVQWLNDAFNNGINQDELIFTLLVALLFWFLAYNVTWHIFHVDRAWRAILPPAMIILLNAIFYSGANIFEPYLFAFMFLTLLVLARSALEQREWEWFNAGVRVPKRTRGQFLMVGGAMAAILVMLTSIAPVDPLQEQAEAFQEFMQSDPLSEISEVWNRLFAPLNTDGPVSSDYYGGDSLQLSGAVQLGDQVIFTVNAPSDNRRYYWRGRVFDTYEYGKWDSAATTRLIVGTAPLLLRLEPDSARTSITALFTVGARSMRLVHALPQVSRVELATNAYISYTNPLDTDNSPMNVSAVRPYRVLQRGDVYAATSQISTATADQLRTANAAYPEWIRTHPQYLRTSSGVISQRVVQLTRDIVNEAGAVNAYDKAKAIERWLRQNITYNQTIPAPPVGLDPIEWFLFDLKQGYCNYYATSMVVMLRSQGIPARMAAGFAQGEYSAATGQYIVREADAHTWVEAYFPGYGWIEFEPTSAQSELNRQGDRDFSDNTFAQPDAQSSPTQTSTPTPTLTPTATLTSTPPQETTTPEVATSMPDELVIPPTVTPTPTPTPTQTPVILPTLPDPIQPPPADPLELLLPAAGLVLTLVIIALLLIVIGWVLYWWWEWRGMSGLSPISRAYSRLERYLSLLGVGFRPEQTPEERRRDTMRAVPGSERPVTAITRLYNAERYGPNPDRLKTPNIETQADAAWIDVRKGILRRWLDKFKFWKRKS
jgi:transglutaminase-like putative cysteine protease